MSESMGWRISSLFAGLGAFELGLESAGLGETVWQVERDSLCRTILARHWPNAERFDDVCTVGGATLARVDLVCGGFPCQQNSRANVTSTRVGLAGPSSGLWREFARIVAELQPRWVAVENVASGAELWFDEVVRDLEQLGFEALPVPLSARDVGAPHERARVFIVARHPDKSRQPVVPKHAQVAQLPSATRSLPGWSSRPDLRVSDGIPGGMARLGNAIVPRCSEVIGHIIRELAEAEESQ